MKGKVWLIGGTSESAALAKIIAQAGVPCLATVTTEAARSLYPDFPQLQIWVGRLSPQSLPAFLQEHSIAAILDASHPFAVEISELAIAAAQKFTIPYLRFERDEMGCGVWGVGRGGTEHQNREQAFDSVEALLASNCLCQQRILLTLGYRSLPLFQSWQSQATLFTRILPSEVALKAALDAGFTSDRLIAIRPPVPIELERALWQHWQISTVVTKASGTPGGEDVKRQVAKELGVNLILIKRPPIIYPQQTDNLEKALKFCLDQIGETA